MIKSILALQLGPCRFLLLCGDIYIYIYILNMRVALKGH